MRGQGGAPTLSELWKPFTNRPTDSDPGGDVWVGTSAGLARFDASAYKGALKPPPTVFLRAALGGTVNDVLLTVVMRALARYVRLHGETANRCHSRPESQLR